MNRQECLPEPMPPRLDPRLHRELLELYLELEQTLAGMGPICELSGRCCRFKEYGHTLFLSEAEAILLVRDAPPPSRDLDDGETCPWQDARGCCTARDARPLGCRLYYCDPAFEQRMPLISEDFIARLKDIIEKHQWPWNYAPLHHHLRQARTEGYLTIGLAADPRDHNQPIGNRENEIVPAEPRST